MSDEPNLTDAELAALLAKAQNEDNWPTHTSRGLDWPEALITVCRQALAQAAEIERLRGVLAPFAAYVDLRGEAMPDGTPMDTVLPDGPTLGDCRRARALLAKESPFIYPDGAVETVEGRS